MPEPRIHHLRHGRRVRSEFLDDPAAATTFAPVEVPMKSASSRDSRRAIAHQRRGSASNSPER